MDPAAAAVVAKTATSAGDEMVKTTGNLLVRVLGPSADELGEYLQRRTRRRIENMEKIAEAAQRKGAVDKAGEVNPRVIQKVLDEGSQFDGPLAAEYFGGMLAGSKTPDGRDDSAVCWAVELAGMSSLQIRLHFLLYREWARHLHGKNLTLGIEDGRSMARLTVDFEEVLLVLGDGQVNIAEGEHAVHGLARLGLIGQYAWGAPGSAPMLSDTPYRLPAAFVMTPAGCELYGWALGLGGVSANAFSQVAVAFDTDPSISALSSALLLNLPSPTL